MDQKRLSILCYQIFGKKYYKNTEKANYIEHITKSQVQEPIRKNPESPVQIETFEFFINLLNIPLPNSEDERYVRIRNPFATHFATHFTTIDLFISGSNQVKFCY